MLWRFILDLSLFDEAADHAYRTDLQPNVHRLQRTYCSLNLPIVAASREI